MAHLWFLCCRLVECSPVCGKVSSKAAHSSALKSQVYRLIVPLLLVSLVSSSLFVNGGYWPIIWLLRIHFRRSIKSTCLIYMQSVWYDAMYYYSLHENQHYPAVPSFHPHPSSVCFILLLHRSALFAPFLYLSGYIYALSESDIKTRIEAPFISSTWYMDTR